MIRSWDDLAADLRGDASATDDGAVEWSVRVTDLPRRRRLLGHLGDGRAEVVLDVGSEVVLPSASIGKILLLVAVAAGIESGRLDPDAEIPVRPVGADDLVGESGLLRYLRAPVLRVADLAVLVAAVSDNLATNVLLRVVGLDEVAAVASQAGVRGVTLHDRVRDRRGAEHPPALSTSSAAGLCELVTALHRGLVVSPAVSRHVVDWLHLDTDLSMVAGAFGLDPLCHPVFDRGIDLWHKTGTQRGVRADCGVVVGAGSTVAYAVLARWDADDDDAARDAVLARMGAIGARIRAHVA